MIKRNQKIEIKLTQDILRAWNYRNRVLEENGYYTVNELIDKAEATGFTVYNPFVRIRKGTQFGTGVIISENSAVEGKDIILGPGTILSNAVLRGSNIVLGPNNKINGDINVSNLLVGNENIISGISGENTGYIRIGHANSIGNIRVDNRVGGIITIGDRNELHDRLNINIPFEGGTIYIGCENSLGRDGGGVISSSYRFGRGWSGPVAIGCRVESTRGAEILGFSVLGWPLRLLETIGGIEEEIASLFSTGNLKDIDIWMNNLLSEGPAYLPEFVSKSKKVSLFGVVKVKRSCLIGEVKIKDDTRVQCAHLRDILIPERCSLYYSRIMPPNHFLTVPSKDIVLQCKTVEAAEDLEELPDEVAVEVYPNNDSAYYQD